MKTRPANFHGVKGKSGAWNKREEWSYRELLTLSKTEIVRLAKKYKHAAGDQSDKHYKFWLEAALALILKDLPVKGEGFESKTFILQYPEGYKKKDESSKSVEAIPSGVH